MHCLVRVRGTICPPTSFRKLISLIVPWVERTLLNNDDFVNSDPYDGSQWGVMSNNANYKSTPWDMIYPGNYVALENPENFDLDGGLDMDKVARNNSDFRKNSQGFGTAVMHQLHCVVSDNHENKGLRKTNCPREF